MRKLIFIVFVMLMAMILTSPNAVAQTSATTKTERVTEKTDSNPVVGTDKKGRTIRQGKKGGLYYWTTTKKGENAGKVRKAYLTKAEKEEFYKTHPNVKRPTNN